MSERDPDIEFDFFDDLDEEPREADTVIERPRGPRGPGPSGPRRPRGPQAPASGVTPLLRLAGLVAFAILIVVLFVFWIRSCRSESKTSTYMKYMAMVKVIAGESEQIGRQLNDILTTPGLKTTQIESKLSGLAQQQQQDVAQAEQITPPGPLRPEHLNLIEALQFRVSGLTGLAAAFRATGTAQSTSKAGQALANQAQRLVTSDVVWSDLFVAPAKAELQHQGVGGVTVPDSKFATTTDFDGTKYWVNIVDRLKGVTQGGTTGGLHGTGLVSVKALRGTESQELSESSENTVVAGTDLGFLVTIQDTGDSQEVRIRVTLTIQQDPPIKKTQTLPLINPGEQKDVIFRNIGQPKFATRAQVKVDVAPVPGETNTSNNSAVYPVIFSLG
jgi:hypothetical protein